MNSRTSREHEPGYFAERPILLVAGLFLLAAIPIGMMMLFIYGTVQGSEFSPDDFTRRDFSYQQIPWLNWTVSGIEYNNVTSKLERSLITSRLIKRKKLVNGAKKTWHLYDDSVVPDSHACDARFLTTYLDFEDWDSKTVVSTPFWLKWNEKFPQSAKIFWPTVADLARNEMYLSIPDVMRLALNVTDDQLDSFKSDLNELTRANWITAGESDLQLGKYQRATKRFIRANLIDSNEETTKLLDQCRAEMTDYDSVESDAKSEFEDLIQTIADLIKDNDSDKASPVTAEAKPS